MQPGVSKSLTRSAGERDAIDWQENVVCPLLLQSVTPLVSIEHLSKSFPGVRALNDCRFELMAGEVHALMGEN